MFIVLQHHITNPQTAFARGQTLLDGNGAPHGTRVRQFYPSTDRNAVFCLWESNSIDELREYAVAVMGDSSENSYFAGVRCPARWWSARGWTLLDGRWPKTGSVHWLAMND
jgi:hypothetical protein